MIQNQPSTVVQQLFEWVEDSLNSQSENKFNTRLLRYGKAFTQFLRKYDRLEETQKNSLSEVSSQFLEGYRDLYKIALSKDDSHIYRVRLSESIIYGLRVSIDIEAVEIIRKIADQISSIFELELKQSTTEQTATDIVRGLQSTLLHARTPLVEANNNTKLKEGEEILRVCQSLLHELMQLSIKYIYPNTLSTLFDLYSDTLDTSYLIREIRERRSDSPKIAETLRERRKKLHTYEQIRPLDLIGYSFQQHGNDKKEREELMYEILERVSSVEEITKAFFDYADLEQNSEKDSSQKTLPITTSLESDKQRSCAYAIMSVILSSPNDFTSLDREKFAIPSSPKYTNRIEQIFEEFENLSIDMIPTNEQVKLGESEIRARIFMFSSLYGAAIEAAKEAAHQSLLKSQLDSNRVESYEINQNEDYNNNGLPELLRERDIIRIRHPSPKNLDGITIIQYIIDKRVLLDDYEIYHQTFSSPASNIEAGYNRYLIRRIFETRSVPSMAQLEQELSFAR